MAEADACLQKSLLAVTTWEAQIRDYEAFSISLLPSAIVCRVSYLIASSEYLLVTTASQVWKRKRSQCFQKTPLQGICSTRVDFTSILILGSDSWGLSWRPEASGKNLDDKREAGWVGVGVGIVYSNALIEEGLNQRHYYRKQPTGW